MRSRTPRLCAVVLPLLAGCTDANTGIDPPIDRMFFPSGILLDPRTLEGEAAKYIIVSNGNNDLSYNAGSVVAIDLEAFFASWATESTLGQEDFAPYPYCEGAGNRCVLDVGSPTNEDFPCRRLGLLPQIVECDERPFVVDAIRIGDFATVMAATRPVRAEDGSELQSARLFLPVRGDPSITWMNVTGEPDEPPDLDCRGKDDDGFTRTKSNADGTAYDGSRCADDHRLRYVRNDPSLAPLEREPFNIEMVEGDGYSYALVAHSSGPAMTLVDLQGVLVREDGVLERSGTPAIVDAEDMFAPTSAFRFGGFGIAQRPCGTCVEEGDPIGTNIPTNSQGCTRPLVYGALRYQAAAFSFAIEGLDFDDLPLGADTRSGCTGEPNDTFYGQFCATPDEIGDECAVVCDPQILGRSVFSVAGVDPFSNAGGATLGEIEFGDDCGSRLYLVQTNPGALLKLDTSLDIDNEPFDIPAGPPLELCDQPTEFTIWRDKQYAFVSCYQSAYLYVVDLTSWLVVDTIIAGTGPHALVVDEVRQVLYAVNSLEASISVIDLAQHRPTRFKEIARIGLREPFRR